MTLLQTPMAVKTFKLCDDSVKGQYKLTLRTCSFTRDQSNHRQYTRVLDWAVSGIIMRIQLDNRVYVGYHFSLVIIKYVAVKLSCGCRMFLLKSTWIYILHQRPLSKDEKIMENKYSSSSLKGQETYNKCQRFFATQPLPSGIDSAPIPSLKNVELFEDWTAASSCSLACLWCTSFTGTWPCRVSDSQMLTTSCNPYRRLQCPSLRPLGLQLQSAAVVPVAMLINGSCWIL